MNLPNTFPTHSPRKLYRVTFRTPDRPPPMGPSILDVVASTQAEAIARAGVDLDALGIYDWSLLGVEIVS